MVLLNLVLFVLFVPFVAFVASLIEIQNAMRRQPWLLPSSGGRPRISRPVAT